MHVLLTPRNEGLSDGRTTYRRKKRNSGAGKDFQKTVGTSFLQNKPHNIVDARVGQLPASVPPINFSREPAGCCMMMQQVLRESTVVHIIISVLMPHDLPAGFSVLLRG